jgi:predicted Zn-dependent protease
VLMRAPFRPFGPRSFARVLSAAALLAFVVQPAAAQSILRDAETEALLRDMATPLVTAAGLNPRNVDIVLVNDGSINAFVAGGQAVYINSGLISEAASANEVQGVIAHELGHITGGHVINTSGGRHHRARLDRLLQETGKPGVPLRPRSRQPG